MARAPTARKRESIRGPQVAYLCELPHRAGLHLRGEVSGRLRDPVPEETCGGVLDTTFAKALAVADRRRGASQGPHEQQEPSTVPSHLRAAGQPFEPDSPLDPGRLAGRSARDIMDAVVEAVRPVDGTQDAEASRQAVNEGLSDLLDRYPDADLLNLHEEQRLFVIERFIAQDVYNRFILDVGKAVQDKGVGCLGRSPPAAPDQGLHP